jgi:carbon-monoxide dehydrogenase medium subunit
MYTMCPAETTYYRPSSLDEALELLATVDDARPLAGGHSLLPTMKLRLATPGALVDIGRIPGLDGIAVEGDELVVGALARHADVAASDTARSACPALAEAAGLIGDPQVRNRGTIGGSIAHADPGADYPTVLTALGATIQAAGKGGAREITAEACFTGTFSTSLEPGELITAVRVPVTAAGSGAAYVKHKHPASGYAVVGVAAVVGVSGGTCSDVRIAVGGATGAPVRAAAAESAISGQAPGEAAVAAAAAKVAEAIADPMGDVYASGEYRAHLAGVLAKRALEQASARAAG